MSCGAPLHTLCDGLWLIVWRVLRVLAVRIAWKCCSDEVNVPGCVS